MIRSATFSEDRKRRFDLVRDFRGDGAPDKTVLFVMLNPSKAGELADDPTIRKTIGFARRWGYGRVVAVNLTPTVSADPWQLPHWRGIDPENSAMIERWACDADLIVVAWGCPAQGISRTIAFPELVYEFRKLARRPLFCIGTTAKGYPLHPSRAPYTEAPELWSASVVL